VFESVIFPPMYRTVAFDLLDLVGFYGFYGRELELDDETQKISNDGEWVVRLPFPWMEFTFGKFRSYPQRHKITNQLAVWFRKSQFDNLKIIPILPHVDGDGVVCLGDDFKTEGISIQEAIAYFWGSYFEAVETDSTIYINIFDPDHIEDVSGKSIYLDFFQIYQFMEKAHARTDVFSYLPRKLLYDRVGSK